MHRWGLKHSMDKGRVSPGNADKPPSPWSVDEEQSSGPPFLPGGWMVNKEGSGFPNLPLIGHSTLPQ